MKKLFTLLTLALISIGSAWGENTELISGITLPDVPTSTIDLSSQTDFTPNAYGWIVFNPYASLSSKSYWSNQSGNKTGTTWEVPDGAVAPFVGSSSSVNVHTLRNNRTYALRFTGAEAVSFLVKSGSSTKQAIVNLYSYKSETHTAIGSAHECTSTDATEIYISGLDENTTYIAYIYSNNSNTNSFVMEIGLKAPVTTYTVTYSANGGTGDDVVDDDAAAVADCPNTFTAPSGKAFAGWNTQSDGLGTEYAVGTIVTSNLTLYAQWATSHAVTYSLGSGTGTAPTQEDLAEGRTFTVASAPGDLVCPTGKEFKCWNDGATDYLPDDTYTITTSDVILTAVYQDKTYKGLTPSSTLDFTNPATTFASVWNTANNLTQNFYFDAPNGVAVMSAFAAYQAKNTSAISWMTMDSGNSTSDTWSATGVFKGSSYYFSSSSKAATVQATERMHYYRVKGITGVSALMGGKAIMEAYLVTGEVVSADPVKESSIDAAGTLSITGLESSNEYIIKVYGDNGSSNVQYKEIAFYFPAVATVSVPVGATGWSTYSSSYALDFGNAEDGIEAYAVTGFEGTTLTTSKITGTVAANTGLLVKGTASTSYNVPVVAEGDAATGNKLVAVITATTVSAAAGTDVNYVLVNNSGSGEFQWIGTTSANVGANKAYLSLANGPKTGAGSRGLIIDIDIDGYATGINMVNGEGLKVNGSETYYDLQGRRVLYPTKGLYIVNGKKVVIK